MSIDQDLVSINEKFRKQAQEIRDLKLIISQLLIISECDDQEYEDQEYNLLLGDIKSKVKSYF